MLIDLSLTVHNCHEIYRDEAVGLKGCKYLQNCDLCEYVELILGNFVKIWYFVNNCFNWTTNLKILLHMCGTYNCDYLQHSTFRFNLIDLELITDFTSQFYVLFIVKSPSVTQRSVSQENDFKKSKNPSPFFRRLMGSNNSFTLIEKNFWFLRYGEVWIHSNSTL